MLKWAVKFLWNTLCIIGISMSLVYILIHGGKPREQVDNNNQHAPTRIVDQNKNSEMIDYMYYEWLPSTTVVIMNE